MLVVYFLRILQNNEQYYNSQEILLEHENNQFNFCPCPAVHRINSKKSIFIPLQNLTNDLKQGDLDDAREITAV